MLQDSEHVESVVRMLAAERIALLVTENPACFQDNNTRGVVGAG